MFSLHIETNINQCGFALTSCEKNTLRILAIRLVPRSLHAYWSVVVMVPIRLFVLIFFLSGILDSKKQIEIFQEKHTIHVTAPQSTSPSNNLTPIVKPTRKRNDSLNPEITIDLVDACNTSPELP